MIHLISPFHGPGVITVRRAEENNHDGFKNQLLRFHFDPRQKVHIMIYFLVFVDSCSDRHSPYQCATSPFRLPTFTSRGSLAHRRAMGAVFVSILLFSAPASANWTLSSSSARGLCRRVEAKNVPIARRCARSPREVKVGKGSAAISRTDEQCASLLGDQFSLCF